MRKNIQEVQHWQKVTFALGLYDYVSILFSYFCALLIRFDFRFSEITKTYYEGFTKSIFIYALFCIVVYNFLRLYRSIWRFASFIELVRAAYATFITVIIYFITMTCFFYKMPLSYHVIGTFGQFLCLIGIRFSYRFILLIRGRNSNETTQKKVMIFGAGESGQIVYRDIRMAKELNEKVCCFIDDNPNKWGRYIDSVPVEGGRESILEMVGKYKIEKIYIAIPSATAQEKRDVLNICNETGCELRNLPGLFQLSTGQVTIEKMKKVAIEDLLGRDQIQVNGEEIFDFINGKVVLVTGGGGSIGSELCRQIAKNNPKQLIIFDVYENNAYDIQLELRRKYPYLKLETLIGSVRDSRRIFQVFEEYRPEVVYHAAAHKHVPLMEDSPCEAIKNNAIGTYKTAYAAITHGCKRFVLISTDKAVNPTNVMGATKRMCEMIIQSFDKKIKEGKAEEIPQLFTHIHKDKALSEEIRNELKNAKTEFVAVRFGNVLGSNGSVIPLFKKQIENGGPVTVTHPDIIRYFMTIPEAVGLVLQAGVHANGGEIFVLDMGEPVKIDTLARNLIRLSGYKPDVDIKVEYSGLRPGEKLYEEKLMAEEGLEKTDNELIHIGKPIKFDTEVFLNQLEKIMEVAYKNDKNIRVMIQEIVSTYHPADI